MKCRGAPTAAHKIFSAFLCASLVKRGVSKTFPKIKVYLIMVVAGHVPVMTLNAVAE